MFNAFQVASVGILYTVLVIHYTKFPNDAIWNALNCMVEMLRASKIK
jgi:hypothetical protein